MAHEVLISYSSFDKLKADAVCNRLESKGIRCWIAPRDVPVGTEYADSIIQALAQSQVLVLIYSSHADKSKQVKREVERAVSNGTTIMPVRIEDVEMSNAFEYYVGSIHWLDAITAPFEDHIDKLAEDLQALISTGEQPQQRLKQSTPAEPSNPSPVSNNSSPQSADAPPSVPDTAAPKATQTSTSTKPESRRGSGMTTAAVFALIAVVAAAGYFYTTSDNGDRVSQEVFESELAGDATNVEGRNATPSNTTVQRTTPTSTTEQGAAPSYTAEASEAPAYTQAAKPASGTLITYRSLVELCEQLVQQGRWGWSCDVPAITTIHPFVSGNCECRGRILLHNETNLFRCEELPSSCGGVSFVETLGNEPNMEWYADVSP